MRLIFCALIALVSINVNAVVIDADATISFDDATTRVDGSALSPQDIARTVADITTSGGTQTVELNGSIISLSIDVTRDDILDDGQFALVYEVYHIDTDGRVGDKAVVNEVVQVDSEIIDQINNGLRPGRVINLDVQINITGLQ